MPSQSARLTPQQRRFLVEASKHEWIAPSMFVGASKNFHGSNCSHRPVTANSAYKVMIRLLDRGLLERRTPNPVLFFLTDAGKEALGA
jgi:hypothetical protein